MILEKSLKVSKKTEECVSPAVLQENMKVRSQMKGLCEVLIPILIAISRVIQGLY